MICTLVTVKHLKKDVCDWMDTELLTPSATSLMTISYAIQGTFNRPNDLQYLHDIAGRIAYQMGGIYEIQHYSKIETQNLYKLKQFLHLDRVPSFTGSLESDAWNGERIDIFNVARHKAYEMKRYNVLNREALEIYVNQVSNKSKYAKTTAKNVFEWVQDNYTGRQSKRSRHDQALRASTIKAKKVEAKIFSALKSTLFTYDSLASAARALNVAWVTFKKYSTQYQNLQQASKLLDPYVRMVLIAKESLIKVIKSVDNWIILDVYQASFIKINTEEGKCQRLE